MRITKILLALVLITLFSFTTKESSMGPWKYLRDKNVGFAVDHDVILFGDLRDDFRQIKLRVTDGPLKMYDMKIHFDNGDVQDVQLRREFRQGSESRVIDLNGGMRHLAKIEFWYETKGFLNGKSRVAVWGRK